jgi:GTP-binding protein EngB required for normal cell division
MPDSRATTRLAGAFRRLTYLCEGQGHLDLADEARTHLVPIEENQLRMVALGQFKRGKSTLVNALLGAPILPTGAAPVTSVSTLVRWAPEPRIEVHYQDGGSEQTELDRLPDFVVEAHNPGNRLGVRVVEVGYPSDLLEGGLVLVDTPGIGSADRAATERAYAFLPSVDAGLVVLSPDPPVGEAEAHYVQELASLTPHILFVLNKVDRVAEAEWREVLAFNRRVLADVLGRDPREIDIVPVSARRGLEDGDGSVDPLRAKIERFIALKASGVRRDLAHRRLQGTAAKLRSRLDVERRALDLQEADLASRIAGLRRTIETLEGRAERAGRAVMAAVDEIVGRTGDALLARARASVDPFASRLQRLVDTAAPGQPNTDLARTFDEALAAGTWQVLDAWWSEHEEAVVTDLLEEMETAADDVAAARRDAAAWLRDAFGVALPDEPRVEGLRDSPSFYRHVEGLTPRLTMDLIRSLLPRAIFRAWVRRSTPWVARQALEMGAGQVRGDLLYRARETARGFAAELRAWTVAGMEALVDAVDRAAVLRGETGRSAAARRAHLAAAAGELGAIMDERDAP